MAKLTVFSIDYETRESTWKVKLLAESKEDAIGYLRSLTGEAEGFRINNLDMKDEIHAITPKVLEGIKGPKLEPEVQEISKLQCPWCESTDYENFHALKMHIVKTHTGKTVKKKTTKKE